MIKKSFEIDSQEAFFDLGQFEKDGLDMSVSLVPELFNDVATIIGVQKLLGFTGKLQFTRLKGFGAPAYRVEAVIEADVTQICGVSLEAFNQPIKDQFDAIFVAGAAPDRQDLSSKNADEPVNDQEGTDGSFDPDAPNYIEDGHIRLFLLVTEWLCLAVDPYPVRPGADWQKIHQQADLNEELSIDPRLSVLQKLVKKDDAN